MKTKIAQILNIIFDLFFPKICEGCGVGGAYLCALCMESEVQYVTKRACHVCKCEVNDVLVHKKCRKKTTLDGVFIAAHYSKFLEDFIGDIKYELYHAMIDDLVSIMIRGLSQQKDFYHITRSKTLMTFVPLHISRRRWRGFNQAEMIAQTVSKHYNIPCQRLLDRREKTHSQMGLPRKKRLMNVQGVFSTVEYLDIEQYSSIIIVDDVMTTGSTLEACAATLRKTFRGRIYGLVCARG